VWHPDLAWKSEAVAETWEVACLLVAVAGLLLRCAVVGHAPPGTSGRNTLRGATARSLNTSGFYSIVRHPLYVANGLIAFGLALVPGCIWLGFFVAAGWLLYYERIALYEEQFLRGEYGAVFEEWAARTPAFLPCLSSWSRPERPFSWRLVLRREYSATMSIASVFAVLDAAVNERERGLPRPDLLGWWILGLGLVIYLVLRTMKKVRRAQAAERP